MTWADSKTIRSHKIKFWNQETGEHETVDTARRNNCLLVAARADGILSEGGQKMIAMNCGCYMCTLITHDIDPLTLDDEEYENYQSHLAHQQEEKRGDFSITTEPVKNVSSGQVKVPRMFHAQTGTSKNCLRQRFSGTMKGEMMVAEMCKCYACQVKLGWIKPGEEKRNV